MRSFLAAVTATMALLLTLLAVPSMWVGHSIASQDGFLALAAPLGKDPQFQSALATAAADAAASKLEAIPSVAKVVQPVIAKATQDLTKDPGYPAAWAETLRRSHELTVVDPAANANDDGVLNLDVAPLLQLILNDVNKSTGLSLSAPNQVLLGVGTQAQRQAVVKLTAASPLGLWFLVAALLAFIITLLSARRRSTTLIIYGVGLAAVAGILKLVSIAAANNFTSSGLAGSADSAQATSIFKKSLMVAVSTSFDSWLIWVLGVGLLMLVAGVIGRILTRNGSVPSAAATRTVPAH
ncbi:hypothetical protein [Psychromicrobium xiongbiense]|uniref:hypothetical protein n=1 Tax=Psychromicrobium xiongbiense TaxID=3051184 RepID=UPI0025562666|nr:hypothetical protein [Psychromicrobium sp. YIM S02556]